MFVISPSGIVITVSGVSRLKITYDYVSHCYSWILNVIFVGKGLIKCIMLHYFVKIHNVRMSFLEQKKNQTYSYFVSLNSVFKDATIFIVNWTFHISAKELLTYWLWSSNNQAKLFATLWKSLILHIFQRPLVRW